MTDEVVRSIPRADVASTPKVKLKKVVLTIKLQGIKVWMRWLLQMR